MSNLNLLSLDTLLIFGRAAALVLAFAMFAWGFVRWRKASERDTQRVFEQLDLVRSDLLIMKEVMQSAAQRVDTAAKQVAHDVRLAPAQSNGAARGYEIAARLARSGAPKEELIKSCGITTHEAELLIRLHGRTATLQSSALKNIVAPVSKPAEKVADIARAQPRSPQPAAARQPARAPQVRSRLVAVG
jgi:hypothetical protein